MGYSSVWEGTQGNGLIWENSRGKFPKRLAWRGNINVAPESPGEDPMNRAAAEEVSAGTESCRNSSPEPEEPGELLCMGGSKDGMKSFEDGAAEIPRLRVVFQDTWTYEIYSSICIDAVDGVLDWALVTVMLTWYCLSTRSLGPQTRKHDIEVWKMAKRTKEHAQGDEVLLTTEAAIRTKERGWIHASKIKGPVDEPKEWTITSEPGDTKLTLKRGLGGNELGRPKWSKKLTQDHT
ncbi:hypothetical protein DUI87_20826 [Hirundo rustica rustica]|uniref:Uncharacterized protein n=1 Tax=Hirundo rustica rustica TaxID=333673 RepID=A0A3M0JTI4_HIRRU|nr:hypothetical protein DUI87_20826 [Hirundo rustica rustica]